MIDKGIHRSEFFGTVVFQQVAVVALALDQFCYMVVQRWRLKAAIGFFAQVEDVQARGQVLIIG